MLMANAFNVESQPKSEDGSPTKQPQSPVKGVFKKRVSQEPIQLHHHKTPASETKSNIIPKTIEDVPFRRQDRRILNARKKRVINRQIIKCTVMLGILLIAGGAGLIVLYILFKDNPDLWFVNPFIIIGITIIVCGVMFVGFSIETCIKLKKSLSRVQDPEIDEITNLHHIKHWIEPDLIPFGWGQDESENGMLTDEALDTATLKDDDVYAGNPHTHILEIRADFTDENPHITMKALHNTHEAFEEDSESIPKEIFDESLRYSGVDRPKLSINRSSPVPQRRGSFMDPEEKIANLFASQGSRV